MRLTDLNPEGGIGANCFLLEWGPFRLILDAGLNLRLEGKAALPALDRLLGVPLDAVLLSHCHLDHLGAIPLVMRDRPQVPLMMSLPSTFLAKRMLINSVNVMMRELEATGNTDYPLYTHREVRHLGKSMVPMAYGHTRKLEKDGEVLKITFFAAGHVVGAASILMEYEGRKVFFTNDISFEGQLTLKGAQVPHDPVDVLITETTRGAHPREADSSRPQVVAQLMQDMARTLQQGGSVLVPVFALGRTQEMLAILHQARKRGELPRCPIFVSGLGLELVNQFDEIARKTGLVQFRQQILKDLRAKALPREGFFQAGKQGGEKGIYILSSGMMMAHTPSYLAASCLAAREENLVAFVGYCAPDTPGAHFQAVESGSGYLWEALDVTVPVRAQRKRYDLTGHAHREELVDFAARLQPRRVVLNHGDPEARAWFAETLAARQIGQEPPLNPEPLQTYAI